MITPLRTLFFLILSILFIGCCQNTFDKKLYLKQCGLEIENYILSSDEEDSLAKIVFIDEKWDDNNSNRFYRNQFNNFSDIRSCIELVSLFSRQLVRDKNESLLYNHYFASGILKSSSKYEIIKLTLIYAKDLPYNLMRKIGEVSFPIVKSINDTLAFQAINRIIPGICNSYNDYIGYDLNALSDEQANSLFHWGKKGLYFAKSSLGSSSDSYLRMLKLLTYCSWKLQKRQFNMYADSLINLMLRKNESPTGNVFYGAIYDRYLEFIKEKNYEKAEKIMSLFSSIIEEQEDIDKIEYMPIKNLLPERLRRDYHEPVNPNDSDIEKAIAKLDRDKIWAILKALHGDEMAPENNVMIIFETARLNYLTLKKNNSQLLTTAFNQGVLSCFPSSAMEFIDNYIRPDYRHNQELINYLTYQYNNNDPRCIYDALLYIKCASEQIPHKVFKAIKNSSPESIYNYADSIRRFNISSREGWERDFLENEIGPKIKGILDENIVSFSDVQQILNENEAAIEFYAAPSFSFSDDIYKAAILFPNSTEPTIVNIGTEHMIKDIIVSPKLYEDVNGYKVIWHPIEKILSKSKSKTKNIYFSMDKLLNICNIQCLKTPDNMRLNQKYNFKQLSSTKEIINENKLQITSIAIFGDINYDYIDSLNINKKDFNKKSGNENQQKSVYRSFKRGSFSPLIYAKTEINDILNHANDNNIKALCYTGKNASEEEFKNLSGEKISILHIATHGFYYPKNNTSKIEYINNINEENMPLNRCGLIMAKSNNSLQNQFSQNNREDGILFGDEIARLDFTDVDLIVLSACCTALGDLNDEGVSGLRQAFKLAGAKSLLITLNNVDDKATSFFMNNFYKELFKTNDKNHSFKYAVEKMKASTEFSNPNFWAPFILID